MRTEACCRTAFVAAAGLLLVASRALAVDLSGTWIIGDASGVRVRFTQTGTTLTAVIPGAAPTATGTVDPVTGAFSIDIAALYNSFQLNPAYCTAQIDAVASPDASTFAGTVTVSQRCIPPPFFCGPCSAPATFAQSGTKTTCPDGVLQSGEVCDDGLFVSSCCITHPSQGPPCGAFMPSGTSCPDDGDSYTDDRCDGAGTCEHPARPCGNGTVDPGEDCDDRDPSSSECCSSCRFQGASTSCADDGNPATRDLCDGAGTCVHTLCGNGVVDPGEACDTRHALHGVCCASDCESFLPRGAACDTDRFSGTHGACQENGECVEPFWCGLSPINGCRPATASKLDLRSDGSRSRLRWKWKSNAAATTAPDLGDPLADSAVVLCLYAGGVTRASALVLGNGTCQGRSCWRATRAGFSYRDPDRVPDGIEKASLSVRGADSALRLRGKGDELPLPDTLALATPVTMQLVVFEPGVARCWESTFANPTRSTATEFRASR